MRIPVIRLVYPTQKAIQQRKRHETDNYRNGLVYIIHIIGNNGLERGVQLISVLLRSVSH